jgi:hypothetical protein
MPHSPTPWSDSPSPAAEALPGSPLHGYQGNRGARPASPRVPASLTIAVSREAGARGGSIARRAGEKLGWQIYTQDVLEYIAQEGAFRQEVLDHLTPPAGRWVEEQLGRLHFADAQGQGASLRALAHMILALGAQGEVVLIGRGAGFLLPHHSTLHVRFVAPLADRIAYMSQWLRLTLEEAAEQVRLRDGRRNELIETCFQAHVAEPYHYDLLLNSSLLGEELCADLMVQAARAKLNALGSRPDEPATP